MTSAIPYTVRQIPFEKVRPAEYNPRTITEANLTRLEEGIRRFGLVEPLVWNKATGNLVGGHQRLQALVRIHGEPTTLPCYVVDMTEAEEMALNVALNNPNLQGEYEDVSLRVLLRELQTDATVDLDLTGFTSAELDRLLEDLHVDPDQVPEHIPSPPEAPVIQLGDLVELGDHRILCGDSSDPRAVARLMGEHRWHLMVADPPYGVDYGAKNEHMNRVMDGNRLTTDIRHDVRDAAGRYQEFITGTLTPWAVHNVAGASYYVFFNGPRLGEMLNGMAEASFLFKHMLVWVKNNHVLGRADYNYKHEFILYGWLQDGPHVWSGPTNEVTVWEVAQPHSSKLHPTMKPVELYERAIRNSSKRGQVVVDPFLGSGTILIACENTGRCGYAMEIDPQYVDVAIQRWVSHTGNGAIKINGEEVEWVTIEDSGNFKSGTRLLEERSSE